MELYRRLARPVFFALPPEGAHHLAQGLLRLPLPWRRIGSVPEAEALHTDLAGIPLRNPVGLAAGFDKSSRLVTALGEIGFGYIVTGTVTRDARRGNAKPRIVRRPDELAIVNSMGLPNKGGAYAAHRLMKARRAAPVLVSLADEEVEDVVACLVLLEPLADGIELNVSSPNAPWRKSRDNVEHLGRLLEALAPRRRKPLFVKLPPFRTDEERERALAMARLTADAGMQGLTCTNTIPVEEPRVRKGSGGLSGKPLLADTVRIVEEVRGVTGEALVVNACGGIFTAEDARACLDAGATTVQVYTGMIYRGPQIVREICGGLLAGTSRAVQPSAR
jgi:dihydroorotate dehydrogenase subfamily 2